MVGAYRSLSPENYDQHPGVGAELMGRWAFPTGVAIGLGARYVAFPREGWDRVTVFLDGRYAPTSPTRRVQPVAGLRAGPYYGGGVGDGDGNPLFGVETAAIIGFSLRAGAGVSFTMLGDLGVVLTSNDPDRLRRFFPGVQVGLTVH